MMLPDAIKGNVEFGYYPAGHMVYLNVDALKMMHADLERFYGRGDKAGRSDPDQNSGKLKCSHPGGCCRWCAKARNTATWQSVVETRIGASRSRFPAPVVPYHHLVRAGGEGVQTDLPDQYLRSTRLREWARRNKNSKYIPEALLEAWGFEIESTL